MKHDFEKDPDSDQAVKFVEWLEEETITALERDYGKAEAAKSSIFLFTNRAYESNMEEERIAELFGICITKAGWPEVDIEAAMGLFELYAGVARNAHGDS